jgi:hypothetical protein
VECVEDEGLIHHQWVYLQGPNRACLQTSEAEQAVNSAHPQQDPSAFEGDAQPGLDGPSDLVDSCSKEQVQGQASSTKGSTGGTKPAAQFKRSGGAQNNPQNKKGQKTLTGFFLPKA